MPAKVRSETSLLLQIVDFYQPNTGRVVLPTHNRGVVARSKSRYQGRFQIVRRWNSRRFDLGLLRLAGLIVDLPVVVGRKRRPISVVQFKSWIAQRAGDTGTSQRWSKRAHNHLCAPTARTSYNQPADHDVITCVDKSTCADVRQLRVRRLRQIVNLHQAHARSAILAGKDSGVSPGVKRSYQR